MNLKYKILWIENEADWASSIEDEIKDIVEDYGFIFEKVLIDKRQENFDYKDYDFILMDMNLSSEPSGDKLIKDIREQGVLTTVLFYSASELSVLRNKVQENELEGVFVASRTDSNIFVDKIRKLVEASIKKVQDLNNLRGLVMAEVSELDSMMDDIIVLYFWDKSTGLHEQFNQKVIKNDREKTYKKHLNPDPDNICEKNCSLNWVNLDPSTLIKVIDASMKARAMKYIIEFKKELNTNPVLDFDYNKYKGEIIDVRNNLAHCESQIVDGKEILKTREGDTVFGNEDFKRIRNDIRKYNQLFSKLKDYPIFSVENS